MDRAGEAVRRLSLTLALAAALCSAAPVPTPQSHFGHTLGADRTALDWDRVVSYFRALAKSSDRLRLRELGLSTEGRPFVAAIIASPATLARLDRYVWIQRKLADPRVTPEAEAGRLIGEGKVVVMITCSIHSTELASTASAVELAYRLLTGGDARTRAILDNTILLLVPSLNPDGVDLVARWVRSTLGTAFEGTSPPELYHKYAGHDNNRDWYFFTQAETRLAVAELHNVWHPQIVYDVHQQGAYGARMFVPPWIDPIDPNVDPILVQECNMLGTGIAADLTAAGKTGVVVNALYDFWSPSRAYQAYHGGLRILSESASARLASPITIRRGEIEAEERGFSPRRASWNYPEPWLEGEWHLRDIVDYQLVAMESVLAQAAARREDLLRNFYRVGQRALAPRAPAAFVIPLAQHDPGAARVLLEKLAFGMVEIERAAEAFTAGGANWPAGTYLIRTAQPYGAFARTLLERQHYPDLRAWPGGPPRTPYDVTAQTLPLLMGVDVRPVEALRATRSEAVREFRFVPAAPSRGLAAADTDSWAAVGRRWREGGAVWRDGASGDFFLGPDAAGRLTRLERPRIGVYQSFIPTADEGWTRWLLEQFGFAYSRVTNREIQAGGLRRRFDTLVFADQPPEEIAGGQRAGSLPAEFTGGLEERGASALRRFAEEGGTLVFLNHAARYAVQALGLALKDVTGGVPAREFYSPGSLLNVHAESCPLTLGVEPDLAIWSEDSPAWEVPRGSPARVVLRYPASGVLASGWLLGERVIAGKAAALEVPLGRGRAVLFGLRPQYRGQSYATFKLFFNALQAVPGAGVEPGGGQPFARRRQEKTPATASTGRE
jgi:hypothetical protein